MKKAKKILWAAALDEKWREKKNISPRLDSIFLSPPTEEPFKFGRPPGLPDFY
jgi:hypothetical protein